jgi:hypothetical protein
VRFDVRADYSTGGCGTLRRVEDADNARQCRLTEASQQNPEPECRRKTSSERDHFSVLNCPVGCNVNWFAVDTNQS